MVKYTAGAVALALAESGVPWMLPLVPLFSFTDEVLSTLCSAALPSMPTFTTAEAKALLDLSFTTDFVSGLAKLPDVLLNIIWNDNCHCVGGALVPIVFPATPSGVAVAITPAPPPSPICGFNDFTPTAVANGIHSVKSLWDTRTLRPIFMRLTVQNAIQSGAGQRLSTDVNAQDDNGVTYGTQTYAAPINPGTTVTQDYTLQNGVTNIRAGVFTLDGTGSSRGVLHADFYCTTNPPGGTSQPCCPPDAATQSLLDSILRMVTLIQRQSVPFAYVPGTAHTALSGAGAIAVSGLIGALIDVTTLPASYGSRGTSPAEHFDLGFITWGTADGYPSSVRIEHDPQLSLPARCSAFTELAYDLAPGVVVTITELHRES